MGSAHSGALRAGAGERLRGASVAGRGAGPYPVGVCFNLRFESEDELAAIAAGMAPTGTDASDEVADDAVGAVPAH